MLSTADVDLWEPLFTAFDAVEKGLMPRLLDKSLLKECAYESLIRKEDGEDYEPGNFQEARIAASFNFIWLVGVRSPREEMLEKLHPLRVKVKQ